MVRILNEMYKNVEEMLKYEENNGEKAQDQEILENALKEQYAKRQQLEEKIKRGEIGDGRTSLIEEDIKECNANIARMEARKEELAEQNKSKINELEISILRGNLQINSKYEQQVAEYNAEIEKLENQIQETKKQEENSIHNVQEKMEQYMNLDNVSTPEDIRKNAQEKINELDANRENVTAYYEGQYAGLEAKIQEAKEQRKKLYNFAEPIVEQAKEIAAVVEQKESKLETLKNLAQKGKEFQAKQTQWQKDIGQNKNEVEIEHFENANSQEQEKLNEARKVFAPAGNVDIPKPIITSLKEREAAKEILKEAKQERKEINEKTQKAQEISDVLIEVKTGQVFIAMKSEVDGADNQYKVVEKLVFEEQAEIESKTLMEENKIALLRKNIPEFNRACAQMEEARKQGQENADALEQYHEYMEKFENVDPIIIDVLDKIKNVPAMEQYVEAVASNMPEKMPFALEYDLRGMKKSEFTLEQKQNILSYAEANKKVAEDIRGMGMAKMHLSMREFERKHPWYGKMMSWFRMEDMPEAITEGTTESPKGEKVVPNKEEFGDTFKVDEQTKNKIHAVELKVGQEEKSAEILENKEESNIEDSKER